MQDFEVCAIGIKMNSTLPVGFSPRIYEASGTARGPLLAFGEFVAAGPGEEVHFAPVNFVLEACKDYDISVAYEDPWWQLFMYDEGDFALPYDVGGVIRVRDGELFGNPSETRLPQLSIIGRPLGCPAYTDLSPPDAPWVWAWGDAAQDGVYVTAKKNVQTVRASVGSHRHGTSHLGRSACP